MDSSHQMTEEERAEAERKRLADTNPGLGAQPQTAVNMNDLASVTAYRMSIMQQLDNRPGNPQLVAAMSDINSRYVELQKARIENIRRKPKHKIDDED